ncbi:hypothetical protein CAEBREN_31894 [Caenorhabditis brenneri]|uniref:Domain of unknown function WSN domain-containing protein n=1 Tax=Caenorhabditis brenneri TaxID=135651 RepID=G0NSC2_CAEBE|nr:hypothetical protein CAEBREN_31894 [Caenorhabditis brenneri]
MTQKKTTQKTNRRFKPGSHSSPPRFCYLWIWIVIFFIAIQYVSSSGLLRPKFDYGNFTSSASSRARFRRDTSKLDNAVRNLGHLARVANGIALEIGLVDGSIKPGEAVSELLLMGDLQLDDIISLNQESIEKVLTAMSQKIQTDQQVEKLEQRLMRMEDVREISPNLLDLKKIPGLKEFETSFKAVGDLTKHKATVAAKQSEVHIWASILDNLRDETKTGLTDSNRDNIAIKFSLIAVAIDNLKAYQTSLDPVKKLIEEGKKMSDNVKFIGYLATENNFRTSEAVDYTTLTPLLLKSFDKVNEDFQAASSAQKEFESILRLIQSRSPLHRQTFKHTAGFPRGSDDLKDLEQSIEDPSIISRISNGESVKTDLKAAFESFKNLEKEIGVISSDWKGLEAQYKSVNDVVSTVIELGKLSDVSQSVSGTVDALVACDKGKYPTETLDKNLAGSINALSNKVGGLGSFGYLKDFSNLDSLKKDIDTRNQPPEKVTEIITNVFNKWKTDETLKTFIANVKKLDEDLKNLLAFLNEDPIKEGQLAKVTKHLKNIDNKDYKNFLNCVKNIQVDGFPVRDLIKFIQDSKAVSVPQDAKDAITKVIQSGTSLTNAQSLAGKFKDDGKLTPKVEVFKSSFEKENYEEVSRKLGLGVQGLAAILKVRTAKIDDLVGKTERILNEAKTDGLSPEQQKSLQQLKEVKTVLDSIDTFLQTSKGLQALRRKRNAGFESFQEVLKDAANVQGATIVVTSLREAINALKNLKVNGLEVDTLATLDLDFAKFNMADAVSSLISMDKFFKKYIALLSGAPGLGNSVTTKPGQKGPSASAGSLVGGKAKEEGGNGLM